MSTGEKTFEERLTQVKGLIDAIEGGKLPLEDAVRQYETGVQVLDQLEKELNDMKRRITVIREGADGSLQEEPMNPDEGE